MTRHAVFDLIVFCIRNRIWENRNNTKLGLGNCCSFKFKTNMEDSIRDESYHRPVTIEEIMNASIEAGERVYNICECNSTCSTKKCPCRVNVVLYFCIVGFTWWGRCWCGHQTSHGAYYEQSTCRQVQLVWKREQGEDSIWEAQIERGCSQ